MSTNPGNLVKIGSVHPDIKQKKSQSNLRIGRIAEMLHRNTYMCGFWREVKNNNAASVMYLEYLAFHPNQ